jgi:hypothetical protein
MELASDEHEEGAGPSTGSSDELEGYKIVTYSFDKYEIKLKLTLSNEFKEIIEVKINKDFLSYKQKVTPSGYHDVDQFYREDVD